MKLTPDHSQIVNLKKGLMVHVFSFIASTFNRNLFDENRLGTLPYML